MKSDLSENVINLQSDLIALTATETETMKAPNQRIKDKHSRMNIKEIILINF